MKLVRYILLILFPLGFVYFVPMFSELMSVSNQGELNILFRLNPLFYVVVLIPIVILGLMLLFIHKIDDWETKGQDAKDDKRKNELLTAIQETNQTILKLIEEIRQDRNERKNTDK